MERNELEHRCLLLTKYCPTLNRSESFLKFHIKNPSENVEILLPGFNI